MTQPCIYAADIEESKKDIKELTKKVVRLETLGEEHGKKIDNVDKKLDALLDAVGTLRNNRGFIGGIAATGWFMGVLMCDLVKPLAKPVIGAVLAVLK